MRFSPVGPLDPRGSNCEEDGHPREGTAPLIPLRWKRRLEGGGGPKAGLQEECAGLATITKLTQVFKLRYQDCE